MPTEKPISADFPFASKYIEVHGSDLHYVEEGDYWEDITVSRDPESNIVCGESDSLSVFVLSAAPLATGTKE